MRKHLVSMLQEILSNPLLSEDTINSDTILIAFRKKTDYTWLKTYDVKNDCFVLSCDLLGVRNCVSFVFKPTDTMKDWTKDVIATIITVFSFGVITN